MDSAKNFKQAVSLSLLSINERLKEMQKIIGDHEKSVIDRFRDIHNEITELENLYDVEIRNLAHFAAQTAPKLPGG
jgi:tetrahydromethanopterin S-methyltransferase subunit B